MFPAVCSCHLGDDNTQGSPPTAAFLTSCWSLEDHRLLPRLIQSIHSRLHQTLLRLQYIFKGPEERECSWPDGGQEENRGMPKMTFHTLFWPHDPRAHTSSQHQMGAAWSGAREIGFGILLDMIFFFFKQKYKASCQQPLPLGNPVLNHSIPEQRCLHRRNLTPLSPGSNAVPSGCMGGRERGSLVAGNQILGEQGCWVVRAATFSSLIPGAPSPILAPDSCQLASLLLSPWAVDISNCTEKQRLRERKQGRQSQSLAQDPTPLPCVLEYRHLSCDI